MGTHSYLGAAVTILDEILSNKWCNITEELLMFQSLWSHLCCHGNYTSTISQPPNQRSERSGEGEGQDTTCSEEHHGQSYNTICISWSSLAASPSPPTARRFAARHRDRPGGEGLAARLILELHCGEVTSQCKQIIPCDNLLWSRWPIWLAIQ